MNGDRIVACVVLALLACGCRGAPANAPARAGGDPVSAAGAHVDGLRDGPWIHSYASGRKQSEGRYERDVQTGPWTYWFENGNKEMEGRFEDVRREGPWRSWYDDGVLRAEGRFERGFEEGPWRFYDRSGALEREGTFELGQPVLRWTYFHPDGSARATGNCLAGVRVGTWTTRDVAGNETVVEYPLPSGCEIFEERDAGGTLERAGLVRDGAPSGRWNSYHPDGRLRLECSFERGEPEGRARAWRDDGSLLACGSVREGGLVGRWIFTREGVEETYEFAEPRPRLAFGGERSPASSAELPGCLPVETWIAELCAPRQPAPIRSVTLESRVEPAPAAAIEDAPGIAARAQPWTEYESRVLPALVGLYGSGKAKESSDAEGWTMPELRAARPGPGTAETGLDAAKRDTGAIVGHALPRTRFTAADGSLVDLAQYAGRKNVLVTILRGFGGQVCVYCTAQTKGLAEFADEFAARDTEVVVVYPGPASGLEAFLEAYRRTFGAGEKIPYRLLYDTDLMLTRALHIEDNIAVPTSILVDRKGIVRWCRVAKDYADRPSAREVLEHIAALPKSAP
jgi:antitoxin component YwqK of YwqJK toxin-antitoxin module/peroxiredoxin